MWDFLLYNLKVGGLLALFYLFYKVLLSRETFHRINRVVILAVVVISFILPVCRVTIYRRVPVEEFSIEPVNQLADIAAVESIAATNIDWQVLCAMLFFAGAVVVLSRVVIQIAAVIGIIRRGNHSRLSDRCCLVTVDESLAPFSWMQWIVISKSDLDSESEAIIRHEKEHIRLCHSWDLIIADLLSSLQWFNPAMWLLRSELRAIHEYEADDAVLRSGVDARQYQMLLIKKAAAARWYSIANSLNHSKLKNRITMMLRKKSSRMAMARVLLLIPLVGIAVGAFARTVYLPYEDKGTKKLSIYKASLAEQDTLSGEKPLVVAISADGKPSSNAERILYVVNGEFCPSLSKIQPGNVVSMSVLKSRDEIEAACERYSLNADEYDALVEISARESQQEADTLKFHVGGTIDMSGGNTTNVKVIRIGEDDKESSLDMSAITIESAEPDGERLAEVEVYKAIAISDSQSAQNEQASTMEVAPKHYDSLNGVEPQGGITRITRKERATIRGDVQANFDGVDDATMIVVDGKVVDKSQLAEFESGEIRRIEIYKGDKAARRFGEQSREAGVVEIKTR